MNDEFYNPTFWHWLLLACVFYGLEIVAPGVFFGFAATASGLVKAIAPDLAWQAQYLLFALFCVISLFGWKRFAKKSEDQETDQPALNQRNQRYLGRVVVLSEPIANGFGKIKVDDSQWKVTGEDAEAGTRVRVTEIDGSILHVEPV